MNLSDVLSPEKIRLRVAVPDKPALLDYLVDIVDHSGDLFDRDAVRRAVREREERLSTGIGHGIALPHAKTDAVRTTTAAVVTCAQPIDYDALDGKPVDIAILILGRTADVRSHLQLLGKLSRLISTDSQREAFRQALLDASSPEQVYAFFCQLNENFYGTQ
ncbi:MAG: PTS sugar transporter subunit IIA [Bacteroidota bacterium]|nr:PTS sugar transporter subunit IIA [Candidatus Kapabacteria bacterium]MCS7303126.1 PTS sugar transporter subunit IIA [Candidatus Kapabacteria bacterium]MCX7936262.1 PTS sugar transporter subunit IIA [Chlorobiota bacterium]MDW8074457.1 PTS sugar transporter subunit IIA [Bacteroidota bacterium]MDW8271067.1 PTS sugar transporter subunit IIA [Bacteroidota bacterium]